MSTDNIEFAEEAVEQKLNSLKIVDEKSADTQKEDNNVSTDVEKPEGKKERRPKISDEERRKQWEEAQAAKPIVSKGLTGTVKWYSIFNRYGFIERDDKEEDIFVHQSAISKSPIEKYYLRTLLHDEKVEFDVVQGQKGLEAANVGGPDGGNVKGSKAFRLLLPPHMRRRVVKNADDSTEVKDSAYKKKRRNRNNKKRAEGEEKNSGDEKNASEGVVADKKKIAEDKKESSRGTRAPRRRRYSRKEKGSGDHEEDSSATASPTGGDVSTESRGARRRASSISSLVDTGLRCDSALDEDAGLGAAAVDAQI